MAEMKTRNTEVPRTHVWALSVSIHVKSKLIRMDILLHCHNLPEPIVKEAESKLALGDSKGILRPDIFMHQSGAMLKWLDPPFKPTQDSVLASKSQLHEPGDPPHQDIQLWMVWQFRHEDPGFDLSWCSVLERRKSLGFTWSCLILAVEESA